MPILSRTDFKALAGITVADHDTRLDAIIPLVDEAIKDYTDRDFGVANVTETREYNWDGRGALEIDDASAITAVTLNGNALTLNDEYVPGPDRGPVYYWIELPDYRGVSPEMGFTWNLDVFGFRARRYPVQVEVTGTFGFPTAPGAVKLAAYYMISDQLQGTPLENLQSESIDTYSRSWASEGEDTTTAIPQRSIRLLDPYVRVTGAA